MALPPYAASRRTTGKAVIMNRTPYSFVEDRTQFEARRDLGDQSAPDLLRSMASRAEGLAQHSYVSSAINRLPEEFLPPKLSVAVLRSHTVEPVVPVMRSAAFAEGVALRVWLGGFNAILPEAFDEHSEFNSGQYDAIVVLRQLEDVAPELARDYSVVDRSSLEGVIDRVVRETESLCDCLQRRHDCTILIGLFEAPRNLAKGLEDLQSSGGQATQLRTLNDRLRDSMVARSGVFTLDLDELSSQVGRSRWFDPRAWEAVRLPYTSEAIESLGSSVIRHLMIAQGPGIKCLVCDLDNTLWGGVVGEDGAEGLKIGPDGEGAYFQRLQVAIRSIRARGVLLAIASKNNPEDVAPVFESHPGMLLSLDDFSSIQIGWGDKATSIRQIASELNIGIDSMAFLDDNPAERSLVEAELPAVRVLPFPSHASELADVIYAESGLDRLVISSEDVKRTAMYRMQKQRTALENSATDIKDYYRSLGQKLEFAGMNEHRIGRIAQLTQKTNQFNLTTRRYTEAQLQGLVSSGQGQVFWIRVEDRFGDNGVVGAAVIRYASGEVWHVDAFLLSCRVIGRTVEDAFMAMIARSARSNTIHELTAEFIPTKKNAPASNFLGNFGFRKDSGTPIQEEGESRWKLDLADDVPEVPEWIQIIDCSKT